MMNFIEYVGDFRVITKGEIQVFGGETVKLELQIEDNDSPLIMLFVFVENKEKRGEIVKDINERTLTWTIYYYKEILSYTIIANPIIIGTDDNGDDMFFSFYINYLNSDEKNWMLKYTFWNKKNV